MKLTLEPQTTDFYKIGQNEIAISSGGFEMRASGINTCSVLIIISQSRRMLAHIDASACARTLADIIQKNFNLEDQSLSLELISGSGTFGSTDLSEAVIKNALILAGWRKDIFTDSYKYTDDFDDLVLSPNGDVYQSEKRLHDDEILTLDDGTELVFTTNAPKKSIEDLGNNTLLYTFSLAGGPLKKHIYNNARTGPARNGSDDDIGIYQQPQ